MSIQETFSGSTAKSAPGVWSGRLLVTGLSAAVILSLWGCGAPQERAEVASKAAGGASPAGYPGASPAAGSSAASTVTTTETTTETTPGGSSTGGGTTTGGTSVTGTRPVEMIPRKIIYTAEVDLVADNLGKAQQALLKLVKAHQGYIAENNISGAAGSTRQGEWKVRVPVDEFDGFMADVSKMGELQTVHTSSQDITAQFVDVQARLSNKKVEEQRLLTYLQKTTAKLHDILEIEQEVSRVRGEIEEMEGQIRLWSSQAALSTVTVSIQEAREYVAPRPTTFGSQISRTLQGSLEALRNFMKGIILVIIALLPWIVVAVLVGIPGWLLLRRRIHFRGLRRN